MCVCSHGRRTQPPKGVIMKRSHGRPYNARLRDMKARYSSRELEGFDLLNAVLNCFYYHRISLFDTAKVLNHTVEDIKYAISIIDQNAQ